MRSDTKKMVFLVFPRKKMVLDGNKLFPKEKDGFGHENKFFPRKTMVLDRKTNFFLGKRWFWAEKPTFS